MLAVFEGLRHGLTALPAQHTEEVQSQGGVGCTCVDIPLALIRQPHPHHRIHNAWLQALCSFVEEKMASLTEGLGRFCCYPQPGDEGSQRERVADMWIQSAMTSMDGSISDDGLEVNCTCSPSTPTDARGGSVPLRVQSALCVTAALAAALLLLVRRTRA